MWLQSDQHINMDTSLQTSHEATNMVILNYIFVLCHVYMYILNTSSIMYYFRSHKQFPLNVAQQYEYLHDLKFYSYKSICMCVIWYISSI